MSNEKNRKYSGRIVDGIQQAPSRAMLRAVGFEDADFKKSQIGIASTWSMVTPWITSASGTRACYRPKK